MHLRPSQSSREDPLESLPTRRSDPSLPSPDPFCQGGCGAREQPRSLLEVARGWKRGAAVDGGVRVHSEDHLVNVSSIFCPRQLHFARGPPEERVGIPCCRPRLNLPSDVLSSHPATSPNAPACGTSGPKFFCNGSQDWRPFHATFLFFIVSVAGPGGLYLLVRFLAYFRTGRVTFVSHGKSRSILEIGVH